MHHSEQSGNESFVKSGAAFVLDNLQEGVQHTRVVSARVHVGPRPLLQAESGLHHRDRVGEHQGQQAGGGGCCEVLPSGQLLVRVPILQPRLDGLVNKKS